MPKVNFYLKPAGMNDIDKRSLIFLQFKYNYQRLVFSFGQKIDPKVWSDAKQRVKKISQTSSDGKILINDLLDRLEDALDKIYLEEVATGHLPTVAVLKTRLREYLHDKILKDKRKNSNVLPTMFVLIDRMIQGDLAGEKTSSTLTTYKTTRKHLQAFEKATKFKVDFNTITLDFKYKYEAYLKALPMAPNSIKKEFKNIKTFMNMALDLEMTTNLAHKKAKFAVDGAETDGVYLKEAELIKLLAHDFSENKKLERIRDFFVFNCNVGLRFGDAAALKGENLVEDDGEYFIKTTTGKTGKDVTIYLNDTARQLIDKYKGFPKAPSNQKFNEYVKQVCETAGLTARGRLGSDPEKRLCDCIGSHTARRTYITNLIQKGIDPIAIRRSTGHSGGKIFENYIKESNDEAARRLGKDLKGKAINNLKAV